MRAVPVLSLSKDQPRGQLPRPPPQRVEPRPVPRQFRRVKVERLPDDPRPPAAVLHPLGPPQNLLDVRLADGEGEHGCLSAKLIASQESAAECRRRTEPFSHRFLLE